MMPAHLPPHKATGERPGSRQRLRMCELLVEGAEGLCANALEIERGGASYTVDSLRALHAEHPEARLTFILGADTARTLGSWREPAQLLELAGLAVATRGDAPRRDILDAVARVAGAPVPEGSQSVRFLEMGPIEVSSSMVRDRVRRGEPVEHLVGAAVAGFIAEQALYRAPVEAAR